MSSKEAASGSSKRLGKPTRQLPKDSTPPDIDEDTREQVESGVASTVDRARIKGALGPPSEGGREEGRPRVVAVAIKAAAGRKRFSPEPHDILKEIAVLSTLDHPNIIPFLGSRRDRLSDLIELFTPWVPYSLSDLLDEPSFTPSPYPTQIKHLLVLPLPSSSSSSAPTPSRAALFEVLTKSIIYQVSLGLDYLHALDPPVAHRDIKPRNVLLTETGCVKLIDFGIAYQRDTCAAPENLWPERPDEMYNDVATGPFRAPELIFGPTTYSAPATDLWSFGATLAHFFTPLKLRRKSYDYDSSSSSSNSRNGDDNPPQARETAYILPKDVDAITLPSADWIREPLFEAHKGSIGLAWSIFSLRGTPDRENWPEFDDLPDANKIQFKVVPPVELMPRLPNLPPGIESTGSAHKPPEEQKSIPLDLIHRLLVYPPEERLKAAEILNHPWLIEKSDVPLLLPTDHPRAKESSDSHWETTWHDEDIGHWLDVAFRSHR